MKMRLPDFLGVGQPRAGTSWLDSVLRGNVGLPRDIKEVDFFVKNYARGLEWYARYFAECDPALPAGEICPSYFGSDAARQRICQAIPHCRIICTFRDPVETHFSFWKLARRNAWTALDFESYPPPGFDNGKALRDWRAALGSERVLALLYDDLEASPQSYLDQICGFIGIARIDLSDGAGSLKVNRFARLPRSHYWARKGRKLRDYLQTRERWSAINLLARAGVWRFCFDGGEQYPPLQRDVEMRLRRRLLPQIESLEAELGRDLSRWKPA